MAFAKLIATAEADEVPWTSPTRDVFQPGPYGCESTMHQSNLLLIAPLLAVVAQADESLAQSPSATAMQDAISQLSDPQYRVRQDATTWFWRAGPSTAPLLERAAQSDDPEVRLRARSVLERFRYGVFADTPAEVNQWIEHFRYGRSRDAKEAALRQLAEVGAVDAVLRLLAIEPDERLQSKVQPHLVKYLREHGSPAAMLLLWESAPTDELRSGVLDALLEQHERAEDVRAIVELGRDHVDATLRTRVRQWIEKKLTGLIALPLAHDDWATAHALAELAANGDDGMRHLATFELLRGDLDKRIARMQQRMGNTSNPDPAELRQLAYLHRARGDHAAARRVAEQLGDDGRELLRIILFESGQWPAALELLEQRPYDSVPRNERIEWLGFRAAFQRMTGADDAFLDTIERLTDTGNRDPLMKSAAAEALLINGQAKRGLRLKQEENPDDAFRLLCRQYRFAEAFDAAGLGSDRAQRQRWFAQTAEDLRTHARGSHERLELALHAVRQLRYIGHDDEAEATLRLLGEAVRTDGFSSRVRSLCETEMATGMTELAYEHATIIVAKDPTILAVLFPVDDASSVVWWEYFRTQGGDNELRSETLQRIRAWLRPPADATGPPSDLGELVASVERRVAHEASDVRVQWLLACSRLCKRWERHDLATRCLQQIADQSASAALRYADELARTKDWESAAHWYGRAWELDHAWSGAIYLQGEMLARLGRQEESRQRIRMAKMLPLSNAALRSDGLARILAERGLREEAIEQWRLALSQGTWSDKHVLDAASELARALEPTDALKSADYWEQLLLSCLGRFRFTQPEDYIRMPLWIEKSRAQQWLVAGQREAAFEAARRAHEICPGDIELIERTVPELNRAGYQDEADRMFETTYAILLSTCDAFPQSARYRNDLAWMSARCDRRLDEALQFAEQALALAPDTVAYIDTLGEVHFRRGDFQLAIASAERCLQLAPDNAFYRQQAERFRSALDEN